MNAQEFCYWLQGHLEISEAKSLDPKQVEIIKKHLALVFTNVTKDEKKLRDYTEGLRGIGGTGQTVIC